MTFPGTNRLDFGGDPDLDPDPGIFEGIFTIAIFGMVKAPHRGFGNSPIIRRLAGLRLNKLKAVLAEVCAVRVLLWVLGFCRFAGHD